MPSDVPVVLDEAYREFVTAPKVTQPLRVHDIPGGHYGCMREPAVADTAVTVSHTLADLSAGDSL